MKTVSPDLFYVAPWAWLVVPALCLLLIQFADQTGSWRDSVVRTASNTLLVAGFVTLILLVAL